MIETACNFIEAYCRFCLALFELLIEGACKIGTRREIR
jgi:hypothetical protein